MSAETWTEYVAATLVVLATPGPSTMLAASHGLAHGLPRTLGTIAGDLSANVLQMIAATAGLGFVLLLSRDLFAALKWFGVGYLALSGLRALRSRPEGRAAVARDPAAGPGRLYLRGFLVSLANPKAILFFATFFPIFLEPGSPLLPQVTLLGSTFLVLDGSILYAYARLAARVGRSPRGRGRERLRGALLIAAALALASRRVELPTR